MDFFCPAEKMQYVALRALTPGDFEPKHLAGLSSSSTGLRRFPLLSQTHPSTKTPLTCACLFLAATVRGGGKIQCGKQLLLII